MESQSATAPAHAVNGHSERIDSERIAVRRLFLSKGPVVLEQVGIIRGLYRLSPYALAGGAAAPNRHGATEPSTAPRIRYSVLGSRTNRDALDLKYLLPDAYNLAI